MSGLRFGASALLTGTCVPEEIERLYAAEEAAQPTQFLPGTPEKVAVLMARLRLDLPLWVDGDRVYETIPSCWDPRDPSEYKGPADANREESTDCAPDVTNADDWDE